VPKSEINDNIGAILNKHKNIAIVGLSASPNRPSYGVANYLLNVGYNIYPVNPKYDNILNNKCYPTLAAIPDLIEIVNIFRKPDQILPVIQESIRIKAKIIWMQSGIVNVQAAELALEAGLEVVMDRCIKIEHMFYR
jgi:predicted CoA-binding protein